MESLSQLKIVSYRKIQNLLLENLNRVNLFVGPNNCGKTSILEALTLAMPLHEKDKSNFIDMLTSRYHGVDLDAYTKIFPVKLSNANINIQWFSELYKDVPINTVIKYKKNTIISDDGNEMQILNLHFNYCSIDKKINKQIKVQFKEDIDSGDGKQYLWGINGDAGDADVLNINHKFVSFANFNINKVLLKNIDALLVKEQRNDIIDCLRIFDKDITNFEIIGDNRLIKLFSRKYEDALSLYDYGNGMYKAFFIITSALLSKNGILLIDEIEAGIHEKALSGFISKLLQISEKNNIQLFLTTHSLEAIDTILYDCDKVQCLDDITVYHIKNSNEQTQAFRYEGERLMNLRNTIGFDVR